jgi:hypothetical protein
MSVTLKSTEVIQQLWFCLEQGYTHEEAQMHIKAYAMGKTTAKEVVVKERE